MARNLRADATRFNEAKWFVFVGSGVAFLLWFFGFMIVAGEWFVMWQSHDWHGQEAAFRFHMTMLAILIFVNQPEE